MRVVSAQEMSRLDRFAIQKIGIPAAVLMESAGRSVFAEIVRREKDIRGLRIAVVCGMGNNGGDGFVLARYLYLHGASPTVYLVGKGEANRPESKKNLAILKTIGVPIVRSNQIEGDLIVDALFGTGLARPLKSPFSDVVKKINASPTKVYSIDIPSGLHADTGEIMGAAVRADVTVTLACKKRGFYLNDGPSTAGEVLVADISIDERWGDLLDLSRLYETEGEGVASLFPRRTKTSHKGSFGHVLVIAGSSEKSGAAVLTSKAALRAGAGLVTLATPQSAHAIAKSQLVEVMTESLQETGEGKLAPSALDRLLHLADGKQSVVIGPGLIPHSGLTKLLREFIANVNVPIVLDADGLNTFGSKIVDLKQYLPRMILTPHPGEMSRLSGKSTREIQSDRINIARHYSDRWNANIVLKGAYTVIALASGESYLNPTGNPAMATAGMGDVLSGIIGAYLAQGLSVEQAAVGGVFHHGLSGDRVAQRKGSRGLLATDVIEELPALSHAL